MQRNNLRSAVWIGFVLLAIRLLCLDVVLEPTNDEGLWNWNARCDALHLPSYGILHSALSPVSYWISRGLFLVVPPSVVLRRVFNSILLCAAAGMALAGFSRRGRHDAAALFLAWIFFDPYLFRMGSWAVLEPLLMAGLICWHHLANKGFQDRWHIWFMGALTGLLIGVKLTVIWVPAGLGVYLLLSRRFKEAVVFGFMTSVVAVLCYASVYACTDHDRFLEIWRQHTAQRTHAGGSPALAQALHDQRSLFYLGTVVLGLLWGAFWSFRERRLPSPAFWCGAFGLAALLTQNYTPERYIFPVSLVVLLSVLESPPRWSRLGVPVFMAALAVALMSNGLWWREFVSHPKNACGWEIAEELKVASSQGKAIAAPPNLSIGVRRDVLPTSVGLLTDATGSEPLPDLMVLQVTAAEPSKGDPVMEHLMRAKGARVEQRGFYVILTVSQHP